MSVEVEVTLTICMLAIAWTGPSHDSVGLIARVTCQPLPLFSLARNHGFLNVTIIITGKVDVNGEPLSAYLVVVLAPNMSPNMSRDVALTLALA